MSLVLEQIPKDIQVGWANAPETVKTFPYCDVQDCVEIPQFEVYFGRWIADSREAKWWCYGLFSLFAHRKIKDLEKYWWYVCCIHLKRIQEITQK